MMSRNIHKFINMLNESTTGHIIIFLLLIPEKQCYMDLWHTIDVTHSSLVVHFASLTAGLFSVPPTFVLCWLLSIYKNLFPRLQRSQRSHAEKTLHSPSTQALSSAAHVRVMRGNFVWLHFGTLQMSCPPYWSPQMKRSAQSTPKMRRSMLSGEICPIRVICTDKLIFHISLINFDMHLFVSAILTKKKKNWRCVISMYTNCLFWQPTACQFFMVW